MSGALKTEIDGALANDLRAAAKVHGVSVECYVRMMLTVAVMHTNNAVVWDDDEGIEEDLAIAEEYDRTGVAIPWEEVEAWMRSWGSENELPPPRPRKLK